MLGSTNSKNKPKDSLHKGGGLWPPPTKGVGRSAAHPLCGNPFGGWLLTCFWNLCSQASNYYACICWQYCHLQVSWKRQSLKGATPTRQQGNKSTNQQVNKSTNQQVNQRHGGGVARRTVGYTPCDTKRLPPVNYGFSLVFGMLPLKYIFHYINIPHKLFIQIDMILNYIFRLGLRGNVLIEA